MSGGGHGNPLDYACLETPMDEGAWWATVHGVAKSPTWPMRLPAQTPGWQGGRVNPHILLMWIEISISFLQSALQEWRKNNKNTYKLIKWKWSRSVMPQSLRPHGYSLHQAPRSMGFSRQEVLEWVAISFSRESSQPREWTQVSHIVDRRLLPEPPRKSYKLIKDTCNTYKQDIHFCDSVLGYLK